MHEYYANDLIDEQERSADYSRFFTELHMGRFGDKTKVIKGHLREFALVAACWKTKLHESSAGLKNLVIASYGKKSVWEIPSFWAWSIRETDIYLRTLKVLEKQLIRGSTTKAITRMGESTESLLTEVRKTTALLENGSPWICRHCATSNPPQSKFCGSCGKPRTR